MTRVDTSAIIEFAKELDGMNVKLEITLAMIKALDVLENAIVQRTPVNVGTLRAAISKEQRYVGNMLRGAVVNPLNYAWPVETGRAAGKMPPVDAIKLWVIRKGIASGREADRAAFLIARAIGAKGTKPGAQMFADGFDSSLPTIVRIFNNVPNNIIRRLS